MNTDTIVPLKGPDRVRRRPAVLFGSEDAQGALRMVQMLLDIFITEAVLGYSRGIDVTLHPDHAITVHSHDRGFRMDETVVDGQPVWQQDFCALFCGPQQPDADYYTSLGHQHHRLYADGVPETAHIPAGDHVFDLCCVQYASRCLQVEAVQGGLCKRASFERGYSVSPLSKEPTTVSDGTLIRFLPDAEVFSDIVLPGDALGDFLRDAAIAVPGLRCTLKDERNGTDTVYDYPDGAADYVRAIAAPTAVFSTVLYAKGRDRYNCDEYDAEIKALIAIVPHGGFTLCLHNHRRLPNGGTHLDALRDQIQKHVDWVYGARVAGGLPKRLVLIVESTCAPHATRYADAGHTAITNRMITDMAADLIDRDFTTFLKQNEAAVTAVLRKN